MGRDDGGPGREVRERAAAHRRRADGPRHRAQRPLPRRPGRARRRCAGSTTRQSALGLVHARSTARSGSPRGCRACPAGSIDYVLVHELAHLIEPGHDAAFWGWVDRYPQAERAKGYLMGWSAAARLEPATPATESDVRRSRGQRPGSTRSGLRLGQRVDRPPAHVERLLADGGHGARRARARRSGRRGGARRRAAAAERHGVLVEVHRHRVEDEAGQPGLLGRLAQRGAGQRRVARLDSGRRTGTSAAPWRAGSAAPGRRSARDHQRAGGEVVGAAAAGQPVGVRRAGARRTASRSASCAGVGRRPAARARRAPRRGALTPPRGPSAEPPGPVEQLAQLGVEVLLAERRRAPRRPRGSRAGRRGRRRSAAGRGASTRRRGPRRPGGCAASPTAWRRRAAGAAAARGRPAWRRSARRDRRRRGGGVRPPGAWRRSASARRWPGRRPRRPSPRPARARSRAAASAAFWAGESGELEHAALEQLLHRLGVGRVDAAHLLLDRLLDAVDVDLDALGVVRDRADQVVAQPRDVGEEPLVGGLAQREVEQHVVVGDVEPLGEGGDVGRHQRGLAGRGRAGGRCRRR